MMSNKIALVVGASSQIGNWASALLGKQGYFVGINDWAPAACDRLRDQIIGDGGQAESFPADPSKKLPFQTMLEHFLEDHGRIDLLINASAVEPRDTLLEMDEWDWRKALDLNLASVFVSTQSVGRVMRELGGGTILNLVDQRESFNSLAYETAAAAIAKFSEGASNELAPLKISLALIASNGVQKSLEEKILAYL
jgi:NAD(P)-dependent dehydrogenase (short-subunit alcohol dehydrogenase family)